MKLIFAGVSSAATLDHSNYLFNCLRNRCQPEYYVPVRSFTDLSFFVNLPGKPDTILTEMVDLCNLVCEDEPGDFNDDFNDDFSTGGNTCRYDVQTVVWNSYIVGQTPNLDWYGVFGSPAPINGLDCFFLRFTFTLGGVDFIYYSQAICIEKCDPLAYLRGCYPNEVAGNPAWDCNGIYYGYHAGAGSPLGQRNYRYIHWAFVRKASLIDHNAKLTLAYFNSKLNYRTYVTKETLFEFELIPAFYKDVLLGIFTRGNIQVDGQLFRLSPEQSWTVGDTDNRLWDMNTNLIEECKQFFGCAVPDCAVLVEPQFCTDAPGQINWDKETSPTENPFGQWVKIDYDGGTHYFIDGGTFGFFDAPQPTPPTFPGSISVASLTSVAAGPANFALYVVANYPGWINGIQNTGNMVALTGGAAPASTITYTFSGGTFDPGDQLEIQVYNNFNNALLYSTIISALAFTISASYIDPSNGCVKIRWRKLCQFGTNSDWQETVFGDCTPPPQVIRGTIDGFLIGAGNDEHREKIVITFTTPTPADIQFCAGWDFTRTAGAYVNVSNGYQAPTTYTNTNLGCGVTPYGIKSTIPAGSLTYKHYFECVEPGAAYGYVSKIVFYGMILPAGYILDLTPARPNLTIEMR